MQPRQPVVVMGRAIARRNERIRSVLATLDRSSLVIDVGAGVLNQGGLAYAARYFATDIRPLPGLDFAADALRMPLRSDTVDVVLGLELLEHVVDPLAVLHETARVLRPGGLAIFSVPATFPRHDCHDYWRFTKQGLEQLAGSVFEQVEVEPFGHTFESLAVLGGYYLQLLAYRHFRPLERVIPTLESVAQRLDERIEWASSPEGLHTLHADLLLVATAGQAR